MVPALPLNFVDGPIGNGTLDTHTHNSIVGHRNSRIRSPPLTPAVVWVLFSFFFCLVYIFFLSSVGPVILLPSGGGRRRPTSPTNRLVFQVLRGRPLPGPTQRQPTKICERNDLKKIRIKRSRHRLEVAREETLDLVAT